MIKEVHHTSLSVSDMNESLAFYRDLLGLQEVRRVSLPREAMDKLGAVPGRTAEVCILEKEGVRVELFHYTPPVPARPPAPEGSPGLAHLAFTVDDIEAVYQALRQRGIQTFSPPMLTRKGGPIIFYCKGPDDVTLEFMQLP